MQICSMELTSQFLGAYDDSERIDDTKYVPSSKYEPLVSCIG